MYIPSGAYNRLNYNYWKRTKFYMHTSRIFFFGSVTQKTKLILLCTPLDSLVNSKQGSDPTNPSRFLFCVFKKRILPWVDLTHSQKRVLRIWQSENEGSSGNASDSLCNVRNNASFIKAFWEICISNTYPLLAPPILKQVIWDIDC